MLNMTLNMLSIFFCFWRLREVLPVSFSLRIDLLKFKTINVFSPFNMLRGNHKICQRKQIEDVELPAPSENIQKREDNNFAEVRTNFQVSCMSWEFHLQIVHNFLRQRWCELWLPESILAQEMYLPTLACVC